MSIARSDAAVFADHFGAIFGGQLISLGEQTSSVGNIFAHHVHALKNALNQPGNNIWMIAEEIVSAGPDVGDEMVGALGAHHQPGALNLFRNRIDVGRPAYERIE